MEREQPSGLPLGFAHRGARAECADNTLASFARALHLGARALETDAWVTADGEVVLDHDGVVREGLSRRPIASLPADRLPPHIPRLADLYDASGSRFELSVDVKDPAAAAPVVAIAARYGSSERLWLCSSSLGHLAEWRGRWAKVRVVASIRRDVLGRRMLSDLCSAGVDVVNIREREWDRHLVDEVHGAGLLAFGWDAQTSRSLDRALGLGVDGVYCDHVSRMMEALERHARGPGRAVSEPVQAGERPDENERPTYEEILRNRTDCP